MNKIISFSLLAFVLFTFYGCPVTSKYPLGNPGEHKIDTDLIGKWSTTQEGHEANEVVISKKDNYYYEVKVTEKGESFMADTDVFTGWLTVLEGQTFLCLQESETGYYVYHIDKTSKTKLKSHDITLKIKGTEAITSVEAYREEAAASLKFDDCLDSEAIWTK